MPLRSAGVVYFVLVFGPPLSTGAVYERFDATTHCRDDEEQGARGLICEGTLALSELPGRALVNDLAGAAYSLSAEMKEAARALGEVGVSHPTVTGSGSCVFGAVGSAAEAQRALEALAGRGLAAAVTRSWEAGRGGAMGDGRASGQA
jgi:4-diphosphocytidyl-2C-methyl-D-erythritol kinase